MPVKRKKKVEKRPRKRVKPRLKTKLIQVIPSVMRSRYLWLLRYEGSISLYTSRPINSSGIWLQGNRIWNVCAAGFERNTGLNLPMYKPMRFRLVVERD